MATFKENNFKTFTLKSKKTKPPKDSEKKYSITYSPEKTKDHFKTIVSSLPRHPGSVAIFGEKNDKIKLITSISTHDNLQQKFRNTQLNNFSLPQNDTFSLMVHLLQTKTYKKIIIYYSYAA